jgi:hypothetical protein
MSKTRNNTNIALGDDNNRRFTGPIEKTNGMVTIAVTAITALNATLTIRQYETIDGVAIITSVFIMVGNSTYFCGQPVVLPFFNVTLEGNDQNDHAFTTVNTVLNPNNLNDHKLQFVNTQTQHMLIQGSRGNFLNDATLTAVTAVDAENPTDGGVLEVNGINAEFNCSTYGNNSLICYEDTEQGSQAAIIIKATTTTTGDNDWVVVGALTVFVGDLTMRYSFSSIRLAAFKRLRIFNTSNAETANVTCSIYSS